ncbi:hypothetical protein MTR67_025869 [Solanum verrucosum]|uniref:Uncharacterized protein n=1 Tax=Solanum verrucosum TaxID=315347 RepID=A0AAF0TU97_SOLVR|nr:hypothetical protein MTR67_025869 [Solanum verrucosum]
MMDAYWRYSSGGQQAAVPPTLTPLVAKRPRNKYVAPSGPGYYERGMMRDKDSMEASYECYLRNGQISSMHSEIMGIQPGPYIVCRGFACGLYKKRYRCHIYSALLEVTKKLSWYQKDQDMSGDLFKG